MKLGRFDTARVVDLARQLNERLKSHNASVAAAGVAFFGLIALVPALVATISLYGLISDPEEIEQQILDATETLPEEASALIAQQMTAITNSSGTGLGVGVVVGVVLALWSSSAAVKNLILTLEQAYDVREPRQFIGQRATALAFTFGAISIVVVGVFILTLVPSLLAETGLGSGQRNLINLARFPVLALAVIVGLMVLYRYGPNHASRDVTVWPGALLAAAIWMLASIAFSIYASKFADFNETYGSLGAIVGLMLWLYLGAYAVVVGATYNGLFTSES